MTEKPKLVNLMHDLIWLMHDLQGVKGKDKRISITPTAEGGLLIEEIATRGKSYGKSLRAWVVRIPTLSGEQALPLREMVEWDEETQQIQQRYPGHYTFQSQRWNYNIRLAETPVKLRWSKPWPFSAPMKKDPRRKKKARKKRGGRQRKLRGAELMEALKEVELDFFTVVE